MTRAGPAWILGLLVAGLPPRIATAQSAAVPPAPAEPSPEPGSAEPGFSEPGNEPPAKKKRAGAPAPARPEDEALVPEPPLASADPGRYDRLIADLNATRGEITLGELIDEILADVVAELALFPASRVGPIAIREVSLGSNVKPAFGKVLRAQITAAVHAGTRLRMRRCIECEATRTRIEDGQWIITRGLVTVDEMRTVGARLGVRSFLDVAFGFDPETNLVEMHFELVRARDALVQWADTFRADETTPILMRASDAPQRRQKRLEDLQMLLEGRPFYGYMASAGFALVPYDDVVDGDIGGATAGFRVYERFGKDRRVMFGLDVVGFLNTSRLAGAFLSGGAWWVPIPPDFVFPELRLGAKAGAFIAGSEGNAAAFQLGAEVLLRYRFGLYVYALFMTNSQFDGGTLGGVGVSTGLSFNW